jgi:hypothetical protein
MDGSSKEVRVKHLFSRGLLPALFLGILVPLAQASETDVLLNQLVEKGVLTSQEAQEIRNEIGGQAKKADDQQRALITEVAAAVAPKWTQSISISGDFRLRHEGIYLPARPDRNRERFRLRAATKAAVSPAIEVGMRLATGTTYSPLSKSDPVTNSVSDPISTNQTMTESFDKKAVLLDWAYLKVTNAGTAMGKTVPLTILGGKSDNPFYSTSLVWDPDVTMEGLSLAATPATGNVQWSVTAGGFPMGESAAIQDPVLLAGQGGFTWSVAPRHWRTELKSLKVKAAVAYYDFNNLGSGFRTQGGGGFGNTVTSVKNGTVVLANRFQELNVTGEISSVFLGRPVKLQGDWVSNRKADPARNDKGYLVGLSWGRTDTPWSYQVGGFYERLEADAVVGQFTDSDFGPGGTNRKGPVLWATLGALKNSTLGVKYYGTDAAVHAVSHKTEARRLQVDWVTKF